MLKGFLSMKKCTQTKKFGSGWVMVELSCKRSVVAVELFGFVDLQQIF